MTAPEADHVRHAVAALFVPVTAYRVHLETRDPVHLGELIGRDLAGVLERGLRDAHCIRYDDPTHDCSGKHSDGPGPCPRELHEQCEAPALSRPRASGEDDVLRKELRLGDLPSPVSVTFVDDVLERAALAQTVRRTYPRKARLTVGLRLFGRANARLPAYVAALRLSGKLPRLGRNASANSQSQEGRARYDIVGVEGLALHGGVGPRPFYEAVRLPHAGRSFLEQPTWSQEVVEALAAQISTASALTLELVTPLRLVKGKDHLQTEFDLEHFGSALNLRLQVLRRVHAPSGKAEPITRLPEGWMDGFASKRRR